MNRTISDMIYECQSLGISLLDNYKYNRRELIALLQNWYIKNDNIKMSWALGQRLKIESPMLAYPFKHINKVDRDKLFQTNWIAERKYDGVRMLIFYHPDEGMKFFSRNLSVSNYLPIEYSNLYIKDNLSFDFSFILDAEITPMDGECLDKTVSIIHSEQMDFSNLMLFNVFDCLHVKSTDIIYQPLAYRKSILGDILNNIKIQSKSPLQFIPSPYVSGDMAMSMYKEIVDGGGEGIILKNMFANYITNGSRVKNTQVKLKRSMVEALGKDIDVWISGFNPSTIGKANENYIGSLKLSTYVKYPDGSESEHWIGTVSGIPDWMRQTLTSYLPDGTPTLNDKFIGNVITIDGQDVSSKELRFSHCRVEDWTTAMRVDKTKHDCIIPIEFLTSQIL